MPMRLHAALLALLAATTGLAGCLGNDSQTTPAGEDVSQSAAGVNADDAAKAAAACEEPKSGNVSDGGGSCLVDDGSGSMDKDLGHLPHIHDYWNGRERVTIVDQAIQIDPEDAMRHTFWNWFMMDQPGAIGGTVYEMPDGAIVYEGTGKMEITASWQENTISGLAVRYRSAKGGDLSEPIDLANGQPATVDVAPDMTDMPHMTTSRWVFVFSPNGAPGVAYGKFHLKIDIVKMADIGLFPGHPELFEGKPSKVILDQDGKTTQQNVALMFAAYATDSYKDETLTPDHLVPMETLAMTMDLTVKRVSIPVGEATNVYLFYRSADTTRFREVPQVSGDLASGVFKFAMPVEMRMVDSPYGEASQWRFIAFATADQTGLGFECGRCLDTEFEYHLTVTAHDHPVEGAEAVDDGGSAQRAATAGAKAPASVALPTA